MDIRQKILSDPLNKWVFDNSPKETYLVGGYMRDLLRGETSDDKDFITKGDAEEIALEAAKKFDGKVIDLHNKQTLRVVLKEKRFIDFSALKNDLMDDLQSRDFTINAIAWSPSAGIMSPENCREDVENRVVRHIKPQNLLDDPLRIFRAYRLSAQLNFKIQFDTRRLLKKFSKKIESVAAERITEELFKLLNNKNALKYIKLCVEDNVLSRLVPLTNYNLDINLHTIDLCDKLLQECSHEKKRINMHDYLWTECSQGLRNFGFIRFYLLLRKFDEKAQRIYERGHLYNILNKCKILRISTRIQKSFCSMEKAESMCNGRMTDKRLYKIFRTAGDCIYEIAIVLAIKKTGSRSSIIDKAEEFVYKRNNTLINGHEIRKILGIESGRVIGEIKDRVFEHQFRGNIAKRREAREFIIRNFT